MPRIGWNPGDFGDENFSITVDGARGILTYSRESSERLLGVYGQEEEIAEWAERQGWTVVGHARDVKVHGQSPPLERPGFAAAVGAVEEKKVSVAVYRLHRLARDFETQDTAMRAIWDAGATVFSLTRDRETGETDAVEWLPDRPGTPQWHLRKRYAQMDEDELLQILDRLQTGRARKMRRQGYGGGKILGGRPYGREIVQIQGRREYRPIPEEQAVIRRICASCKDGGYERMAEILNAEGVPTVSHKPWRRGTVYKLAKLGPSQPVAVPAELPVVRPLEWTQKIAAAS